MWELKGASTSLASSVRNTGSTISPVGVASSLLDSLNERIHYRSHNYILNTGPINTPVNRSMSAVNLFCHFLLMKFET